MTWIVVLLVAVSLFALLAFVLKMPRSGWELTGTALLVGIAGYAFQGHPGQAGAPKDAVENQKAANEAMIKVRQDMGGGKFGGGQSWMVLADGLSRNGQYGAAATVLGKAVKENPQDADLWVALGNALVGHSDGMISPAAQFAFQKAADISPEHPGPPFFFGLALAQSGRLPEARAVWKELLDRSPADAPWREDLESKIARIDSMVGPALTDPAAGKPASSPQAQESSAP
jgi:cytochrome c-type biogenesis protein CcmH